MTGSSLSRWAAGIAGLLLVVTVATLIVTPSSAQAAPPNAYYGTAQSESGTPAPDGTTIVAVANGEVQDSITVGADGQYGSGAPTGEKLQVSSDAGGTVTFHIDSASGAQAAQTDPDPTSEVEQLDLTFPAGTFGGPTLTPTPTESQPTATETQTSDTPTETQTSDTPTETQTAEPTQTQTATSTEDSETATTSQSTEDSETADQSDGQSRTETAASNRGTRTASGTVAVENASLNRTELSPGDVVLVTAAIQNPGEENTSTTVPLVVNGTEVATQTHTMSPGETRRIQFRYRANQTGEFPVAVGSASAGTLSVTQGGLIPWGVLRTGFLFLVLPIALIYGVLKTLAIYYGY